MAVNDTWGLIVRGTVSGSQHIHTLHFRELGGDFLGSDLVTAWEAGAGAAYRGMFPTHQPCVQYIKAEKVCGSLPFPAPVEVVPAAGAMMGTRATAAAEGLPAFVAACVIERGTLAGRSRSGRFFIGGLMETDNNTNDLAPAYITLVQNYANALKAAFVTPSAPNWRLVTHSRLLAQPGVQCDVSSTPVANLLVNARPTTMRSRKIGHGL